MLLRLGNAGLPLRTAKEEPKINGLYNIAAGVRSQVCAKTILQGAGWGAYKCRFFFPETADGETRRPHIRGGKRL